MTKHWEYKVTTIPARVDESAITNHLNFYGRRRWELVRTIQLENGNLSFIMKRPKK